MESILLVLAVTLDAFAASIAYGSKRIKIPLLSVVIINMICTFFLAISIFLGLQLKKVLPTNITTFISLSMLFSLGIYYLFESILKSYIEKRSTSDKKVKFKLFNIWFIIDIYMDETKADFDKSKELDSKEALFLATALSLDSLAIGFGSGLGSINYLQVIVLSLIIGVSSIECGLLIGRKIAEKTKLNFSWLAGIILLILGISRLF